VTPGRHVRPVGPSPWTTAASGSDGRRLGHGDVDGVGTAQGCVGDDRGHVLVLGRQVADRAQQLFDEGRALMKAMKYAQACEKLDESESLDPGGGTILNLGICRRYEGRTATAYAVLTKALARANADHRADRVATAERHLKELAGMLSRLLVRLPMGADASAMTVEIDGTTIPHDQLGQARQLDPGVHNVRATLAGHVPWSVRVTLAPVADEQLVEIPVLEPEPNEKPLTKTHSIIAFKSPLPSQLRASRSRRRP